MNPDDIRCLIDYIICSIAPFGLPIISVCVAVVTILLRRVYGLRYWIVPLGVIGLSFAAMLWIPEGNKLVWIIAFALPPSPAFATADTNELRARPWLIIIVVPLLCLATVFVGLIVGVNA